MANPIADKRKYTILFRARMRGQRKMRNPGQAGNFVPTVRLNPGMVTDLRTARGTSSQLQARRAIRSSKGTRL